ncbi:hydroxymethylglutaryl-CoA lyase [Nocardioides sp. GXZ039]|uniref:hydroxymethylglutaryl-CoA lyase n=1 Tax=Nocardioides sp. GXZ039 TaxID=3136018 RepID=UPI0030F46A79
MTSQPPDVVLRDVSPRDGLQDHPHQVPTELKEELVRRVVDAGVREVEVTSFVSPKVVPQLADAADLTRRFVADRPPARLSVFVGTASWIDCALEAEPDEISMAVPATDEMSQANFRRDVPQMIEEARAMKAAAGDVAMSATVAVAFGCPFAGEVAPDRVVDLASRLAEAGYERILLGDTIGVANPTQARDLVGRLRRDLPEVEIGVHFHDSRGAAVANVVASVEAGARLVDASLAGLGGCPFAPGAAGNVSLEDVVWVLEGMGIATGVDREAIAGAGNWFAAALDVPLASRSPRHRLFDWEGAAS